jgi:hypothetical protein
MISHLACFILSFISFFVTFNLNYSLGYFLDWLNVGAFTAAIFYGQVGYYFKDDCSSISPIGKTWVKIEVYTYYGFIISAVVFVLLSNLLKIKQIMSSKEGDPSTTEKVEALGEAAV